jgi:hypothetical protein
MLKHVATEHSQECGYFPNTLSENLGNLSAGSDRLPPIIGLALTELEWRLSGVRPLFRKVSQIESYDGR